MRIPGEDESEIISKEIDVVISHRVRRLEQSKDLSSGSLNHLENRLKSIKHRTYLWLYLALEHVENDLVKWTDTEIRRKVFDSIPLNVREAYEALLSRSRDQERARRVFSILLTASHLLNIGVIQIALEISEDTHCMMDLELEPEHTFVKHVREYCGLFVSVTGQQVYFLHQTCREFLLPRLWTASSVTAPVKGNNLWCGSIGFPDAHKVLANSCMSFLVLSDWWDDTKYKSLPTDLHEMEGDSMTDDLLFLDYSARHWVLHFGKATEDFRAAMLDRSLELCDPHSKRHYPWLREHRQIYRGTLADTNSMMVAAYYGVDPIVKSLLLANRVDPSLRYGYYGKTALLLAAEKGHYRVVELLLHSGKVGPDHRDALGCTPLSLAAHYGHEAIVKLLLASKAVDPDSRDIHHRTPI